MSKVSQNLDFANGSKYGGGSLRVSGVLSVSMFTSVGVQDHFRSEMGQ